MLRHTTVPLARAWNTWSTRPAEMVFLPLGVRITPVLYSTRAGKTSAITPRENAVRLGRHALDASLVELSTDHAGTRVEFRVRKRDPFVIRGTWEGVLLGEWGQRFWVTLAVSCDGGETASYDAASRCAIVRSGTRYLAVATGDAPLQVTGHTGLAALRADFEAHGYFHTASRSTAAPLLGLRFNLEITRRGIYAAAVADTAALAIERATAALATWSDAPARDHAAFGSMGAKSISVSDFKETAHDVVHKPVPTFQRHGLATQTGPSSGALDAVRDIVAWNTLWDDVNARPYTTVSRIWNLGDFAVWYNDQTYAALMAGLFDTSLARENMAVAHAGATPEGNIACIVTSQDAWVDRSQPPLGSFILWMLFLRTGERSFLADHYETLVRNNHWWRRERDPEGTGLVSCGTSAVGEALYADTAFGARNETGMDNSATHDEAVYDPVTRTLSTFDLGLNCVLCLDTEMLAAIADALGLRDEAAAFAEATRLSRQRIATTLWDEDRGLFANRQRGGGFVRSLSPTTFYPLLCGAATAAQAERLLGHLGDPTTFGGAFVLPNATRDDPAFQDNVYWRGRIWPNVNFLVWKGLRRYGFLPEAGELAGKGYAMFMAAWQERRIAAENYSATTGEPLDQPDTDPFYIWGALLPLMAVGEVMDIDPWSGWSLVNGGQAVRLGPVGSPIGPVVVSVEGDTLTLERAGEALLATTIDGRLTHLRIEPARIAFRLGLRRPGGALLLPSTPPSRVLEVRVGGVSTACLPRGGGVAVAIGDAGATAEVSIHLDPEDRRAAPGQPVA